MNRDPAKHPGGSESAGNQRVTSSPPATSSNCDFQPEPAGVVRQHLILILEDEPALREMVVRHLTRWGYRPLKAANSAEALTLFDRHGLEIDLLLTDMTIDDGTNGLDLAQSMTARHPGLKVIYSSGFDRESIQAEYDLPPDAVFLGKPFQPRVLQETIRSVLSTSR